jgi:hypothetical protein
MQEQGCIGVMYLYEQEDTGCGVDKNMYTCVQK